VTADEGVRAALELRWRRAESVDPEALFADAQQRAASEVLATWTLGLHRPDCFWHERFRLPRGRRLEASAGRASTERYWLDDRGRVLAVEEFGADDSDQPAREVLTYQDDRVVSSVRHQRGALEAVREMHLERGNVAAIAALEFGRHWVERYERDRDGRVRLIRESKDRPPPDGLGWREPGGTYSVRYDDDGSLAAIVSLDGEDVIYRAPPAPVEELIERVAARIAADVQSWTEGRALGGRLARLLLVYGGSDAIIPVVSFQTEDQQRLAGRKLPRPIELWESDIFPPTEYDFAWFDDQLSWLEQELPLAGLPAPAPAVLSRAARLLNSEWSPAFDTTDDFIVYCADHEAFGMDQDVLASVPRELRERVIGDAGTNS
jgi:hypothetical protein